MRKYCYQQEISIMDEQATPLSTLHSRVYIDAVNVCEDAVRETLEEYSRQFVELIDRGIFSEKSEDTNRLNDMLASCGSGGTVL